MVVLLRPSSDNSSSLPQLYQTERQRHLTMQTNSQPSTKLEVVCSSLSVYNIMLTDTRKFLTELLDEIAIMVCDVDVSFPDSCLPLSRE